MEIVENSAVRLHVPTDYVDTILKNVEKAEVIKPGELVSEILVYWGIKEMQFLARILDNDKIPSPITREYSWPGLYKPFKHQITTSSFLTLHRKAFCFNEAGTGKTSSVVWASDYLMTEGVIRRVLVICPLSIMYSAWQADIFKTAMHRTAAAAHGPAAKRKKIITGNYDFVIINYDGVGIVQKEIIEADSVVILGDELDLPQVSRWE